MSTMSPLKEAHDDRYTGEIRTENRNQGRRKEGENPKKTEKETQWSSGQNRPMEKEYIERK